MNAITKHIAEILLLIFLAITFLQSGLDKVFDWKGNLSWLKGHFAKSPLKNMVPLLLTLVTVFEVAAGLLSAIGIFQLLINNTRVWGFWGAVISSVSLLMLFFGQRIAKDYEGAKTIAIYLMPAILAVLLLSA